MVRNEADRYLPSALKAWSEFADKIVALDDGSTDNTVELLHQYAATVHHWDGKRAWGHETAARKFLWEKAVEAHTDFIFVQDADMVPAKDPKDLLVGGIDGVLFCLYDLWSPTDFRSDHYWRAHTVPRLWLVRRPQGGVLDNWSGRGIHSGHFSRNLQIERAITAPKDYSLLHYSYVDPEDRIKKCKQYMEQFDQLTTHEWAHASSITDPEPRLLPLDVDITWPLRKFSVDPPSDKIPQS
jgi:glycosyltransferase involved in cell wall biosynthesis